MKIRHLFLTLVLLLLASKGYSDTSGTDNPEKECFTENVVLKLVVNEEGTTVVDLELLLVSQESTFSIEHMIQRKDGNLQPIRFRGTLKGTGDSLYLNYVIGERIAVETGEGEGRRQVTYHDVGWESTARMRLGEEVILMRKPTETTSLTIFRETDRPQNKPEASNAE